MLLYNLFFSRGEDKCLPGKYPRGQTDVSVLSASLLSERVHKPLIVDECGSGICPSRETIPRKSGFGVRGLSAGSKPPLQMGAP